MEVNTIQARVRSVTYEAEGINSWEFVPVAGEFPPFDPGAHIDLQLPNGLVRSYSLINSPNERSRYAIAVARDPFSRGGSQYVHENLKPGDVITISRPRNNFVLVKEAQHVVFIAGGIGITPLRCMLHRLNDLGRSWQLHYAARSREATAFREELERIGQNLPGRIHLHFDHELGGRLLDISVIVKSVPIDSFFYCCGPTSMLQTFESATAGLPPHRVRVEYFSNKKGRAVDGGYFVEAARSGKRLEVTFGKSILDTLLDAGIEVPFACRQGVCGSCELKVLSGIPDHRDAVLSDEERDANETMMVCCSGSKTKILVLDI